MIDKKELIKMYSKQFFSINKIWKIFKISNGYVKKILEENNVNINHNNRLKYVFTQEHKDKIWEKSKWRKSRLWMKSTNEIRRKNMVWHLKRNITISDLEKYDDIDKLIFLNNVIWRHRKHFLEDNKYISYLDKFFYDKKFNVIYKERILSWKCKWRIPSLEHMIPISKWWTFELHNLTFTTRFENRAKADMTLKERNEFKTHTWTTSNLFYL